MSEIPSVPQRVGALTLAVTHEFPRRGLSLGISCRWLLSWRRRCGYWEYMRYCLNPSIYLQQKYYVGQPYSA